MSERHLQSHRGRDAHRLGGAGTCRAECSRTAEQQSETTVEAGVTYLPPARSGVCEVRRVQFSDTSGWRVREVLVCCTQGRRTSQLTY